MHPHQVLRFCAPFFDQLGDLGNLLQIFCHDHRGEGDRKSEPGGATSSFANLRKCAGTAQSIIGFGSGAVQRHLKPQPVAGDGFEFLETAVVKQGGVGQND